jgi:hypothetical protein
MQSLQLTTRTKEDGTLTLSVPTTMPCEDVDVTIEYRAVRDIGEVDGNGWPIGFFERTAGSIPDIERLPQGEYDAREEW